jgi:hypothetical protein
MKIFRLSAAALLAVTTSLTTPALADTKRDELPQIYTMTPLGVNLQTGMFMYSKTDLTIGSLSFVRSWHTNPSFTVDSSGFGLSDHHAFGHWNHNFGFGVSYEYVENETIANVDTEGGRVKFRLYGSGPTFSWLPYDVNAAGTRLTGGLDGTGTLTFHNRNGDIYTMNANGQVSQSNYADGTRLDFTYNGSKRLRTVISNRGDAIVLDYNGSGTISAACGYNRATQYVDASTTCASATLKVTYGYGTYTYPGNAGRSMLTSATDLRGNTLGYDYDSYPSPNLTCIKLPNSSTCEIASTYPPLTAPHPDITLTQTTATGEVWEYSAGLGPEYEFPQFPGETRTWVGGMRDPGNFVTTTKYVNGQIVEASTREGVVHYEWDGVEPKKFTYPEGNSITIGRDWRQNVTSVVRKAKPGSLLANITTSASYPEPSPAVWASSCAALTPKICSKPTYTIDERTAQTDYTYDSAHGGVLTETLPAVGGVRPQKRYSYTQVYAGVKNSGGSIVSASAPVWLLTQESECKTGTASGAGCAVGGDEVRTAYEYGASGTANALRLRGKVVDVGGLALRTCYTYDDQGNKVSETSPRGTSTSCP